MRGRAYLNLKGLKFGALEVLRLRGSQSTNRSWVYWCRICGHVGHRLGTHLVRGVRTSCPACGATAMPRRRAVRVTKPSKEVVSLYIAANPVKHRLPRTKEAKPYRRLDSWDTRDLKALQQLVGEELRRRREAEAAEDPEVLERMAELRARRG